MNSRVRALLFVCIAVTAGGCGSSAVTNVTGPTANRCQPSITSSANSFSSSGGTGELSVAVARECTWSSSTAAAWIEILSGKEGQGDGKITFRVNANGEPIARKATIAIAEQHAEIAQAAAACRYEVTAPTAMLDHAGARAAIEMRTHDACEWSASSDASWITLAPASGRGNATIDVQAGPNDGAERSVTLTVGPERVVLRQRSAPTQPPPTSPVPVPAPPTPAPAPTPAPTPAPAPPAPAPPTPAPTPSPTPTPAPAPPAPAPAPTPTPTPAPTPAPAPAPAPPPAPTMIEISGRVDDDVEGSCPAVRFELKDYKVRTTSSTVYVGGSCKDLKEDRQITVRGEQESNRSIVAARIEFKK